MSHASWKAHFTQPISGYDPVEAQGLSELGYALLHRQIPETEYLHWARETFELASLDMKFFQTHAPPKEVYEKVKDSYAWGPECVPVAEWEEFLLIASLEKPLDFPPELKPLFLIAPVAGLLQYWKHLQVEEAESLDRENEIDELGGMPEGIDLGLQNQSTPTQNTSLSFVGVKLAQAADHTPEAEAQATTSSAAPAKAKPELEAVKVQPITLNLSEDTGLKIISTPEVTPLVAKVDNPSKQTVAPQVEIKAQPQIISDETVAAEQTLMPENSIKEVFTECKKFYDKQLYIEFNESKKTAYAKFWPQDFLASETPSTYSLTEDSFLAVVAKTQKPYHGYVIKSPLVEKFFKEVNSGQLPENITVVPILKNDVLLGALMGWGNKSNYNLSVLRGLEQAVNKISLKLGWVKPDAA